MFSTTFHVISRKFGLLFKQCTTLSLIACYKYTGTSIYVQCHLYGRYGGLHEPGAGPRHPYQEATPEVAIQQRTPKCILLFIL